MSGPRIGLALGGGGARGAFSAGVINYLNTIQEIDDVPLISGTSTGALVGSMVCQRSYAKLDKIYTTVTTADIINPQHGLVASILGLEAAMLASVIFGSDAVFDASALARIIDKNVDFSSIRARRNISRLLLNTVDLQSGEHRVFDNKKHGKALLQKGLLASASEPVFMPAVDIKSGDQVHQHVDGGVRELVPLRAAFQSGVDVDVMIVVLTNPVTPAASEESYSGLLAVLARTLEILLSEVGENDVDFARHVNATLQLIANARAAGVSDSQLFKDVDPELVGRLMGKRAIPILLVAPETRLTVDSLDFDPEIMTDMRNLGFNRAIDILEPWFNDWWSVV